MSTTVDDAQQQADLLLELINSLPSASDPNVIRPEIQTEALTLHGMELSLVGPAEQAAAEAAAAHFDTEINWAICYDSNVRPKVIGAAKSCEPINGLGERIRGWAHVLGTLNWVKTPEVPAAALPNYLSTYRSITGT